MPIRVPDNRELKLNVQLQAMNMTVIGSATGDYSVRAALPSPQNKNPLNFDATVNRPIVQIGAPSSGRSEFRTSRGIKILPNVQNATISEVSIIPSASRCTFAYGGVDENTHPTYQLLRGPALTEYDQYSVARPNYIKTLSGLNAIVETNLLDIENMQPFVPFFVYSLGRLQLLLSTTDPKIRSLFLLQQYQKQLTTYNIWNLYLTKPNITDPNATKVNPLYTTAKKYEGPIALTSSTTNPSLKTVRDGTNGTKLLVQCLGKGKTCTIKREFPTSKDCFYGQSANIFYPTRYRFTDYSPGSGQITGYRYMNALNFEAIKSQPANNTGFHITLSDIESTSPDSYVSIFLENTNVIDNIAYSLQINLTPGKLPSILIRSRKNNNDYYYEYTNVKGLPFAGNSKLDYDVFVHFAGPVLLVGFTTDQSQWNAIYPEEVEKVISNANSTTVTDVSKNNIEFYFQADKSYVSVVTTNSSFQMTYSAITFNNFSFDPLETPKDTDQYLQSYGGNYETLITKNYVVTRLAASVNQSTPLAQDNLYESLRRGQFVGSKEANYNLLPPKLVSVFGDYRYNAFDSNNSVFGTLPSIFLYRELDSYTNSQYGVLQKWGKVFFNGTIEGACFLGLTPDIVNVKTNVDFIQNIINGNLSPWVESCSVNCNIENANSSRVKKTASITLKNLDTTERGIRMLELLEHNVLLVTISAGYGDNNNQLNDYFQGFITNIQSTRDGSQSSITLDCTDFATYVLENLYFDDFVPFGTLTLKNCIQACINASGFADYYAINNEADIWDLNLRISDNAATSQDSIQATQYDRIGPKLNTFLEKLVRLTKQPTFRWEENVGFVLDARYANENCDTDLKFINYDFDNDYVNSVVSSNNQSTPDWHGLLQGGFNLNTNLANIVSEIQTFGVTTIDGTKFATTVDAFSENALSTTSFQKVINSLKDGTTDPVPQLYVGFRKKVLDYLDQFELPSKELLALKHSQNEATAKKPFHTIGFNCYVTKPLKFHGTFVINAFLNGEVTETDKYIYTSLGYNFNKSTNLIIASVNGQAQPWTIKELQVREGTILSEWLK